MNYSEFWSRTFLGNAYSSFAWCIGLLMAGYLLKKYFSGVLSWALYRLLKRYVRGISQKELRNLLRKPLNLFFALLIFYIAFSFLTFPASWNFAPVDQFGIRLVLIYLYSIAMILAVTWIILRMIDFFGMVLMKRAEHTESKLDDLLVPYFKSAIKIIMVILAFFFMLGAVFHVNIIALVGGLGIGGLALALASKETVENLFGSITIFFDKPFTVGDRVKVGEIDGHVERIGLRSTQIRTLEKSLFNVPNKKMIDAETENITRKSMWRARFFIGLTYDTSPSQLKSICTEIQNLLDTHEQVMQNSTVRFSEFGASSLDILVIYYVLTSDADEFNKVKEEINFEIMHIVEKNRSSFAFPSRSIYLHQPKESEEN